jgi:multicomponent Na+:H+ antiporter subunit G
MADITDIAAGVLAIAGGVLVVLAGVGVVRFRDVYARMHAATKASTLGIALIGVAAALALESSRAKIFIAVAFVFITAPSAAHFVGRAAYRAEGIDIDLEARDDLAAMIDGAPEAID